MTAVATNKVVYITYALLDDAGTVVQQNDMPVGYLHGGKSGLFEKIEKSLEGHGEGERVEVVLSPAEGFGEHDASLTFTDDIDNVPEEFRYVGAEVTFQNDAGETRDFRVTRIEGGKLTIDGNNPLAGKTLTCVVNVVSIRDATVEEIARGEPADPSPALYH